MPDWTEEFFVENAELYAEELEGMDEFAGEQVRDLLTLLTDEFGHAPTDVLDVGCGFGRHCIEFAAEGLSVTGIDISPDYLSRGRERAATDDLADAVALRELDMRNLDTMDETFDLVVCLYNTFGYYDDETNREVLRQMRKRLTSEGVCTLSVPNKDTTLKNLQTEGVRELDFGMVIAQYEFDTITSRMTITRDVLRGDSREYTYDGRVEYEIRQYSPPELERELRGVGFDDVTLFGGYDGDPPSLESSRLLALAR
jgi:SAM-dependent methyltransferase